jgi:hypothetical protein
VKSTGQTALSDLDVVRLSRTDWRVSSVGAPEQVLGYVERQRADRYEIVLMTDPMRWGYATSFDDALMAFGDAARFAGEILEERAQLVGRLRGSAAARARRSTWVKPVRRTSVA